VARRAAVLRAGRRFAPPDSGAFTSAAGFGYMNAAVTRDGARLTLDFGNSFPMNLDATGVIRLSNLGPVYIALLKDPDFESVASGSLNLTASVRDGDLITPDKIEPIATLSDYDGDWINRTGGIVDMAVPQAARPTLEDPPLAILLSQPTAASPSPCARS
jgi:hypothetical protein